MNLAISGTAVPNVFNYDVEVYNEADDKVNTQTDTEEVSSKPRLLQVMDSLKLLMRRYSEGLMNEKLLNRRWFKELTTFIIASHFLRVSDSGCRSVY